MIRNSNVKPPKRRYSSRLRDDQAEATRTRILDALVRSLAGGVADLSVPRVAREAGVSVPTVYRHFGSKKGLLAALGMHVGATAGLLPESFPETIEEFEPMVRKLFRNLAGMDASLRAVGASDVGRQARHAAMPERLAMIRGVVDRLAPAAAEPDRDRLAQLILVLVSTPAFQAYNDYLGLGPDGAARLVGWAVETLVDGVGSRSPDRDER